MLTAIEKYIYWWHPTNAQKLGHKSRDNLSKTYTARNPNRMASVPLASTVCSVAWFVVRFLPTMGSQNENASFPAFDEAAKRVPGTNPGNVAGVGFLSGNQHDITEGVGMESGHGAEEMGEHFAVPGLQRAG